MAYALTILATLAAITLATPVRDGAGAALTTAAGALSEAVADQRMPLERQVRAIGSAIRERAMGLIREQLHQAIEEEVQ